MEQKIIEIWKENKVDYIDFVFSCGGDSMNDTELVIYDEDGEVIQNTELSDYFDNEVYKNVEFYEASDGHYIGESGTVVITLNEDEDVPFFNYSKGSTSEWSEWRSTQIEVELTDEEVKFITDNVMNINGGANEFSINYKRDFIMTDEDNHLLGELEDKLDDIASGTNCVDEGFDGEETDWYRFSTDDDIKIEGNKLHLIVEKEYYAYTDE